MALDCHWSSEQIGQRTLHWHSCSAGSGSHREPLPFQYKRTGRMHRPESMKFVAGYDRGDYRAVRDVVEFAFPDCGAYPPPVRRIDKIGFRCRRFAACRTDRGHQTTGYQVGAGPDRIRSALSGRLPARPSLHAVCPQPMFAEALLLLLIICSPTNVMRHAAHQVVRSWRSSPGTGPS